ncbi:peptidoglycan-binding domain-containing protein [Yinghuangia seranimata]|uniref:peptidoglycan-binding domain-containing protein n=1 Tax=Yinghuangia seranimata TaxID=408067 RepID=UPI00248BE83A|nr:peptidoglycan-binding protein [Yinghuangia seranimata]MDI2126016.1 peptidoglycan-binding domain-containing protein [Yinghuangia seranimata]
MIKQYATRLGVLVAAIAMAVGISGGTANASPNAPWIGWAYTTSGTPVWCVQHLLNNSWAPLSPPLAEDGYWGPKTERRVREYQEYLRSWYSMGDTQVDGIVGPHTGHMLLLENYRSVGPGTGPCYDFVPSGW